MEAQFDEFDRNMSDSIDNDVNSKRKRKKTNYKKINNQTRQKLIEMVKKIFLRF
jgi:hypothetical protein